MIGHRARVRVTKNKVAPPFRTAEFDIMFGEGISHEGDLLDIGLDLGILEKRASYYYYDGELIEQGRENTKTHFAEHPDFATKLEKLIRHELLDEEIPMEIAVKDEDAEEEEDAEE